MMCVLVGIIAILVGIIIWLRVHKEEEQIDKLEEEAQEIGYEESPEEKKRKEEHEALVQKCYYELLTDEEKKEWDERKKREAEEAKEQERREKEWKEELARREKEKEKNLELFRKAHGSTITDSLPSYYVCYAAERYMSGVYSCRI